MCCKKKSTERKVHVNECENLLINISYCLPTCFDQYE